MKYQDGDTDNTLQAKYQAKVDELAKMRRSASPDAAKVELIFQKNQNITKMKYFSISVPRLRFSCRSQLSSQPRLASLDIDRFYHEHSSNIDNMNIEYNLKP